MEHRVCYIVDKKLDGYLATKFGWTASMGGQGLSPVVMASLRGLYDAQADELGQPHLIPEGVKSDDLSNEQLDDIFKKLLNFRSGIMLNNRKVLANATKHTDRSYDALRHAYSLHERKSRVSLISNLFSSEVDRLTKGQPVSRQAVVNGFRTIFGDQIGGEFSILEGVYNQVLNFRQLWYERAKNPVAGFKQDSQKDQNGKTHLDFYQAPQSVTEYQKYAEHVYNEYTKILENWDALVPFVLKDLVKKEGIKLGVKKEYAITASSDTYGDNDIADKWDISESKRDGWQENSDLQSAFGSVGQQVRRILATVPKMQPVPEYNAVTGRFSGYRYEPVVDDMGNQEFIDPIKTHQALMEMLRGIQNSDDMLNKLQRRDKNGRLTGEAKVGWMQPILEILISNPQARTQFFHDFRKIFQPYSIMYEDEEQSYGRVRKINTRILNKRKNLLLGKYEMFLSFIGKDMSNSVTKRSVIGSNGEIRWQRLAELRKEVKKWVHEDIVVRPTIAGQEVYGVSTSPLLNNRDATIEVDGKQVPVTYDMKREFLMDVFSSLGFDVTMDTVDSILNSNSIYTVRDQLEQLFDTKYNTKTEDGTYTTKTGILYALEGDGPKNFFSLTSNNEETRNKALNALKGSKFKKFRTLYKNSKKLDNGDKVRPVKEHIGKLLDVISSHQEGYRVESRVRYNGNTMYSFVSPSYLGDRLEAIQSFVNENDKQGLINLLKNEYLCSPYFVDDEYLATNGEKGKILNTWLKQMVEACNDKRAPLAESVASIFTFERDLGKDDKKFEDFTSKEHAIDMFVHFFADEQQNKGYGGKGTKNADKKLTALYPVFVLGDAGVSKYIRAPRISSATRLDKDGNVLDAADRKFTTRVEYRFDSTAQDKVLDGFWNIYLQERRRMAMDKAMTYQMYANGKPVKHAEGEFSILTFLNPESDEYNDKYAIPRDKAGNLIDDETTIKKIIRQYLDDAALNGIEHIKDGRKVITPSFKQRLQDLGVLDTSDSKNGKVYNYISSIANNDNIDDKVKEFYWNTKLATAQQLQLMTIDPSFYHGTKDLQKRYKEIHAPGSVLDIRAIDFNGNLYSSDGIERVVYFNDISINAEETNPEFMETILRIFAKEGADVDTAIKDGILTPQDDELKETERQNKLADLLGDNYNIYKSYMKNTLTDGQGYRTLTSYRRVMGMAGKWTRDMDSAYNAIMTIRKKHEQDGKDITPDELKLIASYALVLQPIKPYMFTHEKYPVKIEKKVNGQTVKDSQGNSVMIDTYQIIPVQHKYAEALIIPELMPKGSKLRDLGLWMDKNNIDMVGSTKIAKVGCFGQATIDNVTTSDELNSTMSSAYVHELPYRDYRIQTNVPEHINSSQLFGTQVRKLIMAGLRMDADYSSYIGGTDEINLSTSDDENDPSRYAHLRGRNLLALYNSLICANIFDSFEKFANNASDIQELSELLQQSTVNSMRESMDNLFSYVVTGDEKFLIPLFEGGLEHDSAALILSTFKKIVNKQQISGGSAVQVSAFGIDGYKKDGGLRYVQDPDNKGNILYAEIEMPFDRTFIVDVKNADGSTSKQKVSLPYDKYCNMDGTLIPTGQPIEKGTEEWKKYQSYTYKEIDGKLVSCNYDDPEAKVYKPLIEEEYPDILSILAYRIPTERDYSMINCKIKRFTSKMAGGTLKVPSQGTTIAGFDFDIDKLYFMQREYHKHYSDKAYSESNFTDADKWSIWTQFYEENPEISDALTSARAEAEANGTAKVVRTPIVRKGVNTGRYREHHEPLNSFWKQAKIEELFNISKQTAFSETAQKLGISPIKATTNEKSEWMETYDFSKSPEENTRSARNNLLISLIQARLMDPSTVKQRYTPGGFAGASKAARTMRELQYGDLSKYADSKGNITSIDLDDLRKRQDDDTDPEPNYDPTDPYTILVYNQQNQVAGKLIGIFANQNTNHAFASIMDDFELNKPIEFCGHSFKDLLHKGKDDEWKIDLNMAEFLAASVDAVKDPVLNFLNLNTITADAGAVLARLGYSMEEIGLLFNQPVIKKACEDTFNRGANINNVIKDIKSDLMGHLTGVNINDKVDLSSNVLAMGIVNERRVREEGGNTNDFLNDNARTQLAVLELFQDILKVSRDVSDFVLNTKFTASNAVSSTFGGMYAQQLKVQAYLDKFPKDNKKGALSYKMVVARGAQEAGMFSTPIENDKENVDMFDSKHKKQYLRHVRFNPFAYEQAMYDANRKAIKILSKYYPYETPQYKEARERMESLARFGTLSEDDINDIHSNLTVALLARQENSLFNGEAAHKDNGTPTNLTNREYYREKFAEDLGRMVAEDKNLAKLSIFQYLSPTPTMVEDIDPETGLPKEREIYRIDMQDVGGLDSDTKEEIRESWAYLMEVDDKGNFINQDYAELGRDLFMYCFYQLGFDFSPYSFMHLAPTAVKDNILVERSNSLPLRTFDDIVSGTNDVLVWSSKETGAAVKAEAFDDDARNTEDELIGNAFKLPDKLTVDSIYALVNEARSHPELNFKIDRDLTQEEFNLFSGKVVSSTTNYTIDIPSNIYFSKGTLNSVSEESKNAISYGRKRTYRQFLDEILNGIQMDSKGTRVAMNDVDSDEFAQMFILNHLDNSRFVLSVTGGKSTKRLNEIISKMPKDAAGNITIDISSYLNDTDSEAIKDLVSRTISNGQVLDAIWCPCIKVGNSYYMPQSGELKFNENRDYKMTYVKVEPWGTSKTLDYDGDKKLAPCMRYQTSLYAKPERNKDYVPNDRPKDEDTKPDSPTEEQKGSTSNFDGLRKGLEDYVFNELVNAIKHKNGSMPVEDMQKLRADITSATDDDIMNTVDTIRKACRENGVMMLNEKGEPMQGC